MLKKLINLIKEWGLVLIGFILLIFLVYFIVDKIVMDTFYRRYTIGKPIKVYNYSPGLKGINYKFQYKGNEYIGDKFYQGCDTSKFYIVRFSYLNPEVNLLLQNKLIPDSVKVAPYEGWSAIPNWVIEAPVK